MPDEKPQQEEPESHGEARKATGTFTPRHWREWLGDRFGWQPIRKNVLERRVPKAPWYYGDGATLLLLLGVLVVTGALLTLTYSPSPDTAYASIVLITERQILGWFVRGLHYWSAGLMVFMLLFHVFRLILVGGYKSPREGTWLVGVGLFIGVFVMSFTGYILRWDERALYGLRVALHLFSYVPLLGEWLVLLVQGGREMGALTLTRLYGVHVILVPTLLLLLAGYHLYLVILHGITSPAERRQPIRCAEEQRKVYKEASNSEKEGERFYPATVAHSGAMGAAVLAIIIALTLVAGPQPLYPEANLLEPTQPREEWWFWWFSALSALLPPEIAPTVYITLPIAVVLLLTLLPFLDKGPWRGIRKRPFAAAFVAVSVLALFYLSDLRRASPWTGWPTTEAPPVPVGVTLTEDAERGRQLFARYGCNSCHPIAGRGPQVGTDLAWMRAPRSRAEIRNYVLQPPAGIPMPSYLGRMTPEELERVVEFVHVAQTFPRKQ